MKEKLILGRNTLGLIVLLVAVVFGLLQVSTASAGYDLGEGLVGHWEFNEWIGTTAADSSGTGNDGSLVNDPLWIAGVLEAALDFDGTEDYVQVPHDSSLNHGREDFTYSIWMKAPDATQIGGLMSKRVPVHPFTQSSLIAGCQMDINGQCTATKKIGVFLEDSTNHRVWAYTQGDVIDGDWHLVTLVRDGDTSVKIYVDGVQKTLQFVQAWGNADVSNGQPLRIGTIGTDSRWFDGELDDARVYSRALSAGEIVTLYAEGSADVVAHGRITPRGGPYHVDDTVNYEFDIRNEGPNDPSRNLVLVNDYDETRMTIDVGSISYTGGLSCDHDPVGGVFTCTEAGLWQNAYFPSKLKYDATLTQAGSLVNGISVVAETPDDTLGNNDFSITRTVQQ